MEVALLQLLQLALQRRHPDGRLPLILASNNHFSTLQSTQFIVLAGELEEVP